MVHRIANFRKISCLFTKIYTVANYAKMGIAEYGDVHPQEATSDDQSKMPQAFWKASIYWDGVFFIPR